MRTIGKNTEDCVMNGEEDKPHITDKPDKPDIEGDEGENVKEDEEEVEEDPLYKITRKQRMSLKLNDETIEAVKDVFRALDKDSSGTLDTSELGTAMRSMGVDCGDKEIEELMKQIDEDGNGTVDFFEFAQMVSSKMSEYDPEKELKEAFAVFDMNGDGRITVDELRTVADSLGGAMSEAELESMLLEADDNNDGYLDYAEFVRIWMGEDAATSGNKAEESEKEAGDVDHTNQLETT